MKFWSKFIHFIQENAFQDVVCKKDLSKPLSVWKPVCFATLTAVVLTILEARFWKCRMFLQNDTMPAAFFKWMPWCLHKNVIIYAYHHYVCLVKRMLLILKQGTGPSLKLSLNDKKYCFINSPNTILTDFRPLKVIFSKHDTYSLFFVLDINYASSNVIFLPSHSWATKWWPHPRNRLLHNDPYIFLYSSHLKKKSIKFNSFICHKNTSIHQHINAYTVRWSEGFRNSKGLYVPIQIQLFNRNTTQVIAAAIKWQNC